MSRKTCPKCGRVYPSSYRGCPYCSPSGSRRRSPRNATPLEQIVSALRENKDRVFLLATAVFLLIAIFGMILSRCSDPAAAPKEPDKTQQDQQPAAPDPQQPETDPVVLTPDSLELYVGESAALTVSGGSEEIVWASSNEAVASVTDGTVTAVAVGSSTVTAASGAESAMCVVTVKEKTPEVELYLNRTDFTLRPGPGENEFQMQVKVRETRKVYEGTVVWSSADPSVATVSETGLVQRVGLGTTTVTATMGEKKLECIVRSKK